MPLGDENDDIRSAINSAITEETAKIGDGGDSGDEEVPRETKADTGSDNEESGVVQDAAKHEGPAVAERGKTTDKAVSLSEDKPPTSWSPSGRERWNSLDPEVKKEITRREEASANGVRQLNERFAPAVEFAKSMTPVIQEAKEAGIDPMAYIGEVVNSERRLRTSDPKGKLEELLRLADKHGLPLRDIINNSVGEEVLSKPTTNHAQLPPELMQEFNEIRTWKQQLQDQVNSREIQTFSQGKEFFEDVRGQMADLIERGLAQNLDDAYDKATWANPEIRKVMIARERQSGTNATIQQRQERAKAVGIASSGSVDVPLTDKNESLGDTVRNAWKSASGRM